MWWNYLILWTFWNNLSDSQINVAYSQYFKKIVCLSYFHISISRSDLPQFIFVSCLSPSLSEKYAIMPDSFFQLGSELVRLLLPNLKSYTHRSDCSSLLYNIYCIHTFSLSVPSTMTNWLIHVKKVVLGISKIWH